MLSVVHISTTRLIQFTFFFFASILVWALKNFHTHTNFPEWFSSVSSTENSTERCTALDVHLYPLEIGLKRHFSRVVLLRSAWVCIQPEMTLERASTSIQSLAQNMIPLIALLLFLCDHTANWRPRRSHRNRCSVSIVHCATSTGDTTSTSAFKSNIYWNNIVNSLNGDGTANNCGCQFGKALSSCFATVKCIIYWMRPWYIYSFCLSLKK